MQSPKVHDHKSIERKFEPWQRHPPFPLTLVVLSLLRGIATLYTQRWNTGEQVCFGVEIEEDVLSLIFRDEFDIVPSIEEGAFSHDRVQQAAHALIEDVEQMSFHVGFVLWKRYPPSMLMSKMLAVATRLNKERQPEDLGRKASREAGVPIRYRMLPEEDCHSVARLNLQAGEKAASIAAFSDATRYLEKGASLFIRGG